MTLQDDVHAVMDEVTAICQPSAKHRDLYPWRVFFSLWHHANIFNDQPFHLGAGGGASKPSSSTTGNAGLKTTAAEAKARLDEWGAELVRRRWIEPSAMHKQQPSHARSALAQEEIQAQGHDARPSPRLSRALSLPASLHLSLSRRRSTSTASPAKLKRLSTVTPLPLLLRRRLTATATPTFKQGDKEAEDEERWSAKIRNRKTRALMERIVEMHRVQVALLFEYEAGRAEDAAAVEARKDREEEASVVEAASREGRGVESVGDQLASFSFGRAVGPASATTAPVDGDDKDDAVEPTRRASVISTPGAAAPSPSPPAAPAPAPASQETPSPTPSELTTHLHTHLHSDTLPLPLPFLPHRSHHTYTCPICLSLAHRPVRLPGCAHLFCLRCLVKMQRVFFDAFRARLDGAHAAAASAAAAAASAAAASAGSRGGRGGGAGTAGTDAAYMARRLHAGPMRNLGVAVAWALQEQETEMREAVRVLAQERERERERLEREREGQREGERGENEGQEKDAAGVSARRGSATTSSVPNTTQDANAQASSSIPTTMREREGSAPSTTTTTTTTTAVAVSTLASLPAKLRATADCPLCRHAQAVALADGSHIDLPTQRFLEA